MLGRTFGTTLLAGVFLVAGLAGIAAFWAAWPRTSNTIRGDAAIVAPVTAKALPTYLESVWMSARSALASSRIWLVVGYSLPAYDALVRKLLSDSARDNLVVHVFDPDPGVVERFQSLLAGRTVVPHKGLPDGIGDLEDILGDRSQHAA